MESTRLFTHFDVTGTAKMFVQNGISGPVYFKFTAANGCVPATGEIVGSHELLNEACDAGHVTLAMLDMTFRVKVIGTSNSNGALFVESAPLFGALFARANCP